MTKKGPIRTFFSFLIEDFKKDLIFIGEWSGDKRKFKYTSEQFLDIDWKKMLEDYWIWFLIVILAFCVGFFIASVYYEGVCNQFIYDTYIKPGLDIIRGGNVSMPPYS